MTPDLSLPTQVSNHLKRRLSQYATDLPDLGAGPAYRIHDRETGHVYESVAEGRFEPISGIAVEGCHRESRTYPGAEIKVCYVDSSNYKFPAFYSISGPITPADVDLILTALSMDELGFLPEQFGLDPALSKVDLDPEEGEGFADLLRFDGLRLASQERADIAIADLRPLLIGGQKLDYRAAI